MRVLAPRLALLSGGASLLALLMGGCGAAAPNAASDAAAALDGCVSPGPAARIVTLHPGRAETLKAVKLGTGATTVVLSNESDENLCSWLPLVALLRAHGYSALLYDYVDPAQLASDAGAGAAAARGSGARRVVLMGASVGARASIEAAATHPPGVAAVVTLSAERTVPSDPTDLVLRARLVTVPALLISARGDPFVDGATPPLLRAIAGRPRRSLELPGIDHGTALVTGGDRRQVDRAILAFLATVAPAG